MPKRTSAFSKALQEAQQGAPIEQDTSIPVERQASIPVNQQESEIPVQRDTSEPARERDTSEPVQRDTGIPVYKDASGPVEKQAGKLIKASYYISEADDWKLEQIRIQRRRRGVKIDKSALIREAIGLLQE